jgi:hypothetical protein
MTEAKPYVISKHVVWEAYKRVKANRGAAGVDGQSLADFEKDLKGNLYKLWNRMSSGSYFPPPVRLVEIPKAGTDQTRPLGIPTVSDRIAQMVVKLVLEPQVEPHFHADSYGYRPGKSALDAVGITRQRCWRRNWVIDLFMHYAFDEWLRRNFPDVQFARYADDAIVHAHSLVEAEKLLAAIRKRLAECHLELHPVKTKIVYCKDDDRRGTHEHTSFDFLGYTFRPRRAKNRRGKLFISFLPGVSNKAANSIRATIRSWRIGATRNNQSLEEIAKFVNRICLRYGRTEFVLRLDDKSRMSREVHVRFREGLGVRFPRATRLVIGFREESDARRCLAALKERFAKFGLELHPDKTRLIEFGRYAE